MKKDYVGMQAELLLFTVNDVLTESAEFIDPETGDNGMYFPTGD